MTAYTAEQAHAAVKRGAAWLDEKCPEWFREINLDVVDLQQGDQCILGQTAVCLTGRVVRWRRVDANGRWVVERGFQIPWMRLAYHEEIAAYEMLTIAWKEYIRERLESAP